jgi:hypothetical protein
MEMMLFRFARILVTLLVVAFAAAVLHNALGFDGAVSGLTDLALLIGGGLLVSLSDRELFWAASPRERRSKHRDRAAA